MVSFNSEIRTAARELHDLQWECSRMMEHVDTHPHLKDDPSVLGHLKKMHDRYAELTGILNDHDIQPPFMDTWRRIGEILHGKPQDADVDNEAELFLPNDPFDYDKE